MKCHLQESDWWLCFLHCFVSNLQTWAMNLRVLLKDCWFAFSRTRTSSQSVIWLRIEEFIDYCGCVITFYLIVHWTRRSSIPQIVKIAHSISLDLQIWSPWRQRIVNPTLIIVLDLEEEPNIAIVDSQHSMVPNPPRVATPSSVELAVVSISHHPKQMAMQHDKYHRCIHDNYFTTNA
jgi:hypothetical protein